MANRKSIHFYIISLAVLLMMSAYPLVNGVRMLYLSSVNGAVEPVQYAKYVVPYAAMCFAVILFAVFLPLMLKIKRFAFSIGLVGAFGIFIAVEQFFEKIQIHTVGMALIDTGTFATDPNAASATVDVWQASLCIASPLTLGQSVEYALQDRYLYVMANETYKIHYYLIALILIAMVCGLVYGIGRMLRSGDLSKKKPLVLQGISTAALLALCVFANTTAFFRQRDAIQTPLASVLTCLFFVVLGAAVGVYIGSFLSGAKKRLSLWLPAVLAVVAVILMYIGEAAMMGGGLYRFGAGWLFNGLPGVILAPVDIAVILISGISTLLILKTARKKECWPDNRTLAVSLIICVLISASGIGFALSEPKPDMARDDILGCYEYEDCLYMNPLSSFLPVKEFMPYVYGVSENGFVITNTETGDIEHFNATFEKTPVPVNEFTSKTDFNPESSFLYTCPTLVPYKERWLCAVFSNDSSEQYGLYLIDNETWLVRLNGGKLWSIYRMKRTDKVSLSNLNRAYEAKINSSKQQMTFWDLYELARKGNSLTFKDFERFEGKPVGPFLPHSDGLGFSTMRYNIAESACTVIIHGDTPDGTLNYARLVKQGYDPFDEALSVDLRNGAQAVAEYMNPLNSLMKLKIEDSHEGSDGRELIYEFDGYRYYLNTTRADKIFITFENGDRLPLKQALEERRLTIEDAVANGLYNVFMEPVDNPSGGYFPILHHLFTFELDGEAFYPSASFMYLKTENSLEAYFDISELENIRVQLKGIDLLADSRGYFTSVDNLISINGKSYVSKKGLAEMRVSVDIGWMFSSHTPVRFAYNDR